MIGRGSLMKVEVKFYFGDKVCIDNDADMVALITGVRLFNPHCTEYEVDWFANGEPKRMTVDEWRLSAA